jgi:2-polyprenyl-6-hydroxyphenyl methylase/3-demethylubiquinone-9 3-methyltransferase
MKTAASQEALRHKFLAYNAQHNVEARRYSKFRNELKYARRLKTLAPPLKLLDIACGRGVYTAFWAEQGFETYGFDIDAALVTKARQLFSQKGLTAHFVVGRAETLPYYESFFDLCIANGVLEHVQDWQATLTELTRVLKPGGLLILTTTNKIHPFQREINHFPFYPWIPERLKTKILARIMTHRPDMVNYSEFPALHWFTYEQLKASLENFGYKVYSRIDLIEKDDLHGWKATARFVLDKIKRVRPLRYLYYFYTNGVSLYTIK